ncbi:Spy/CpxP family protein refolding chaperone [Desulfobaculum bizertense]|uniref:Heavy-metal resistance n=1 Tax=Desulfobaculum bizertense DSM 18034 TaxID=1121442 RepID=A0A1T4VF12_9BACT|nr:periplasmic heavy metal sensor [Desulfobaculum bizertense]UIJ37705.1 periplasmic heavy metal sensor [Desulfobaculum bizertense]SKA63552.1 Heavy-metal resistance [Desulfobaculum bizertense DSM 18034]
MLKKTSIMTLAALVVFALSAVAYAGSSNVQNVHHWGKNYCGQGYQNLTPEQQAKADALSQEFMTEMQPLRQQVFAKRAALDSLIAGGNASQAQIDSATAELNDARNQCSTRRVEFFRSMQSATGMYPPAGHGHGHGHGYGHGHNGRGGCY